MYLTQKLITFAVDVFLSSIKKKEDFTVIVFAYF